MPNPQLTEYITTRIAQGASKEEIKSTLLGAGWQEAPIDEAWRAVFPGSAAGRAGSKKGLIVALFVLLGLLLAGGGFAYWWYFVKEPVVEQLQQEKVVSETPKEETIQDILEKAQNIGSMSYEIVGASIVENNGSDREFETDTMGKVWEKGLYGKFEGTNFNNNIKSPYKIIIHPDVVYDQLGSDDSYVKSEGDLAKVRRMWLISGIIDELKSNKTVKDLGREELNGDRARKLEYEISYPDAGLKTVVQIWLWEEKGIPLKLVYNVDEQGIISQRSRTVLDYKNYVFGDVSDDIFFIPEDKIKNLSFELSPETGNAMSGVMASEPINSCDNVVQETKPLPARTVTIRGRVIEKRFDDKMKNGVLIISTETGREEIVYFNFFEDKYLSCTAYRLGVGSHVEVIGRGNVNEGQVSSLYTAKTLSVIENSSTDPSIDDIAEVEARKEIAPHMNASGMNISTFYKPVLVVMVSPQGNILSREFMGVWGASYKSYDNSRWNKGQSITIPIMAEGVWGLKFILLPNSAPTSPGTTHAWYDTSTHEIIDGNNTTITFPPIISEATPLSELDGKMIYFQIP